MRAAWARGENLSLEDYERRLKKRTTRRNVQEQMEGTVKQDANRVDDTRNAQEPFILAMSDHLFEAALLKILLERADPALLNLAIDRKIESILRRSRAAFPKLFGKISRFGGEVSRLDQIPALSERARRRARKQSFRRRSAEFSAGSHRLQLAAR